MELCERGSSNNLDDTLESVSKETKISTAGEDDVYGTMGDMLENSDGPEVLLFSFGKGEGKSKGELVNSKWCKCHIYHKYIFPLIYRGGARWFK